jgi:hypothetical protein
MSDRRYERESARDESDGSSPLHQIVDATVRRVSSSLVIAGGLIALGLYAGGGGTRIEAPAYQIATSADGQAVYRINTESGSIVACRSDRCWLMQRASDNLGDEPPAPAPARSLPAPATAAPPAQLPAPAPATR